MRMNADSIPNFDGEVEWRNFDDEVSLFPRDVKKLLDYYFKLFYRILNILCNLSRANSMRLNFEVFAIE